MNGNLIFLVNLASTWYLVGLIWMVQVVHYNLFDRVGQQGFIRYETDHARLITPIVGPPMIVELVTAAALLLMAPAGLPRWVVLAGLLSVVAIWLSTAFIQVPLHNRLSQGFDADAYQKLVATNWIRTLLWTARGIVLLYFATLLLSAKPS